MRLGAGDRGGATRLGAWLPLRWADPPPPGLVAAYAFDEGFGATAVDATGAGSNGVVVGGTWAPGRYGGALSFDGTNDYVGLPALGTFYNSGFTLEAWVQKSHREERRRDRRHLDGKRADAVGRPPRQSRYHLTLGSSFSSYLDSGRTRSSAQWQHLAATFDGATARYYVDGARGRARAVSGSVGNSNTWRIGAYGERPGGFFDGMIDEVRVYDRALSARRDRVRPRHAARARRPGRADHAGESDRHGQHDDIRLARWTASTDDDGVDGLQRLRRRRLGRHDDVDRRSPSPGSRARAGYQSRGRGVRRRPGTLAPRRP